MTGTRAPTFLAPFVPGDALRAATALSVVVLLASADLTGAALLMLTLGGTVIPRAVGARTGFDVACGASLLLAAWASQLGWYESVAWLDLAVHAVVTGLLASLAATVLGRWSVRVPAVEARARPETVLLVTGLGAVLAIVWEIAEWVGHTFVDESIGVGYGDTVSDLAAGLLGSFVAGIVAARSGLRAGGRSGLDAGGRR